MKLFQYIINKKNNCYIFNNDYFYMCCLYHKEQYRYTFL